MKKEIDAVRACFAAGTGGAPPVPERLRREISRLARVRPRRASIASRILVAACALALGTGLSLSVLARPSPLAGQASAFCQMYEVDVKINQGIEFLRELMESAFQGGS